MKKRTGKNTITHENIFDLLGFSSFESEALKVRAYLLTEIIRIVQKRKYTPRDLEKILDQPQPRISEIMNGKISKMSIEKLIFYLEKLGVSISIKTHQKAA
jgi:predicted XRE-type DNA-binding protein